MTGISTVHSAPSAVHNGRMAAHSTMKAPPLITIRKNQILMPGDSATIQVDLPDQKVIAESLRLNQWPPPQLATIKNKSMILINTSKNPVIISEKKDVSLKITPAMITDFSQISHTQPQLHAIKLIDKLTDAETIGLIKYGKIDSNIKCLLDTAHLKHRKVFDKDLSGSYNGYFGHHVCKLNWTSLQRPEAKKVPIANYDHDLKEVMQEICDNLTQQGMLKNPQEHNICV